MTGAGTDRKGRKADLFRVASYLAYPYKDLPQNLSDMKFEDELLLQLFSLLDSNKALSKVLSLKDSEEFPLKNRIVTQSINRCKEFRESYENAQGKRKELLNIIAEFNRQNIRSALIKSYDSLPLDSDNFDILLTDNDLPRSFRVLKDSGFVQQTWYHEPYKWIFGKVEKDNNYVEIHLHTAIAWDGIKFVDEKDLWTKYREKEIGGVKVGFPSPEHHLLTTIAHAFTENREFRLGDLINIIQDVRENSVDWNYVFNWVAQNGWFDSFFGLLGLADHIHEFIYGERLIQEKAYESVVNKYKMQRTDLLGRLTSQYDDKPFLPMKMPMTLVVPRTMKKILTVPHVSFLRRINAIACLAGNFAKRRVSVFRKHPVFLVCFIGQDGVGKTTHAKLLWKELKDIDKKVKVRYIWSRGFGYSFQPFLFLIKQPLLGSKTASRNGKSYSSRRRNLLTNEPMKSVWASIMILDHLIHLTRVRLALSLGNVVICDRWMYDTLIDVKCDIGRPLGRFMENILEKAVPKPGITFVLDARTEELAKRRPEIDLNLLEYKRVSYLNYSRRRSFNLVSTDSDLEHNRYVILSKMVKSFFSQPK